MKCLTAKSADKFGIFTAILCGIHCFLTQLILLLPLASITHESMHHSWWGHLDIVCLGLAIVFAMFSFWPGFQVHQKKRVFICFAIGCSILLTAILYITHDVSHELHTYLMVVGGGCIALSHYLNITLQKSHSAKPSCCDITGETETKPLAHIS